MQGISCPSNGMQDGAMAQQHTMQEGLFLVTTNAKRRVPWLTMPGVPEVLIWNLAFERDLFGARLYAFNILPNHMHIILNPGERGISKFMQSFKTNSMKKIRYFLSSDEHVLVAKEIITIDHIRWQHSFHLRALTGDRAITAALAYVQHNAVHHHLVDDTTNWPWSSVHYPHLVDPMTW